jgi:catechol 2,3-dioxygenase-like lactoylglutathione lyase family enzyme
MIDLINEQPTSTKASTGSAPNLMFSHMGISVIDLDRMTDFYTRVLGFTITDRGADEEIIAETQALCAVQKGYEPYANWRARIAMRMTRFAPPTGGG